MAVGLTRKGQRIRDGDLRSFETRTYAIVLGGVFAEALADPGYDLDRAVDDLLDFFHRATAAS